MSQGCLKSWLVVEEDNVSRLSRKLVVSWLVVEEEVNVGG